MVQTMLPLLVVHQQDIFGVRPRVGQNRRDCNRLKFDVTEDYAPPLTPHSKVSAVNEVGYDDSERQATINLRRCATLDTLEANDGHFAFNTHDPRTPTAIDCFLQSRNKIFEVASLGPHASRFHAMASRRANVVESSQVKVVSSQSRGRPSQIIGAGQLSPIQNRGATDNSIRPAACRRYCGLPTP